MNESSFDMVLYVGGSTVSLWRGSERVAVRSLHRGDIPQSLQERSARLMLRIREIVHMHFAELKQAAAISIVLGSPWVTYHTRTIEHTREKPFTFSHDLEETLVKENYATMKKEIERIHGPHTDVVIGLQIQDYILNGHSVRYPFGVAAYRCTLSTIVAFAQKKLVHDVLSTIELLLHRDDIHIQSQWQWMAGSRSDQSGIACILGAATTDIMWLEKGVVRQTASIACGYEDFVHREAHMISEVSSAAQQAQTTDTWSRECATVLYDWSSHAVLPSRVEIFCDSTDALGFAGLVAQEVRMLPFFTTAPDVNITQQRGDGILNRARGMIE